MDFQKQTFKLMLIIFVMLMLSNGVSVYHGDVTRPINEKIGRIMLGDSMMECMKDTYKEYDAETNDPKVDSLQLKLYLYFALFLAVQLGILYLGSAFIVRKFNQAQKKDADKNSAS
jgi:hypothetical protein